jgi:hypothetical protein
MHQYTTTFRTTTFRTTIFRTTTWAALLIAPLALGLAAGHAHAADKPFMAAVGLNHLTNGEARDLTKANGFSLGAGYQLPVPGLLRRGRPSIDLDYARNAGSGNRIERAGVYFSNRFRFGSGNVVGKTAGAVAAKVIGAPYYGFGLGVTRLKARAQVTSGGVTTTASESKTRPSARALLGYEFPGGIFVEGSYTYTGKVAGVRGDALGVAVGAHF